MNQPPNEIINATFNNLDDTVLHWRHYIDRMYIAYWNELGVDTKMSLYTMAIKLFEQDPLWVELEYNQ